MARTGKLRPGLIATGMALVLAAALLALLATGPADAAGRYKTVTKTFSSTQPIAVPAGAPEVSRGLAAPYPSEISVGGLRKGKILDANVTLKNFGHTYPEDVHVMLSHGMTDRTVMSSVGGSLAVNDITLRLDDEAALPLADEAHLIGGTFKPTNIGQPDSFPDPAPAPPSDLAELSGFDGSNPNGPWSLWVLDAYEGDVGQFAGGWSVTIKARVLR